MTAIVANRMTAKRDGDFAVFLIGVNRPWKVWKRAPAAHGAGAPPRPLRGRPSREGRVFQRVVLLHCWRAPAP